MVRSTPRGYQVRTIEMLDVSLDAGHMRPVIQIPTGGGKTLIATVITRRVVEQGGRVIFVVPRITLISQTIAAFKREGLTHIGVIQANHPLKDPSAPVQIASLQSLVRREMPTADLVVVDECHLQFKTLNKWMADWPRIPFIGLSATPWAAKMADRWDDLLRPTSILNLIDEGYLCKFVVFAPSVPDLRRVRTLGGDFREDELARACDKRELIGNIIDTWLARSAGIPTICYGVNQLHARHIMHRFIEAGIRAEYVDCHTLLDERDAVFNRFRSGATTVICNVAIADTGVDLPLTGAIIDARPTQSEIRYVQTIGRGLRPAPGKDRLIILDHSGNTRRLGFVTHLGHEELLGSKPLQKTTNSGGDPEQLKLCPECKTIVPVQIRVCPECSFEISPLKPVVEKEGNLIEIDINAELAKMREDVRWVSMFKTYAERQGYKPGFAGYKFKEKFGRWPNGGITAAARKVDPDDEVMGFIAASKRAWMEHRHD